MRRRLRTRPAPRSSILFLFPLLWGGYASVQGQAGSGQETGFGFGNYTAMAEYGEGIATYLLNTAAVSLMTVVGTLVVVGAGRLRVRALPLPGQGAAVPGHAGDPDGPVRDDPDPAVRGARGAGAAELAGRAEPGADHVPAPVRDLHDAQLVRGGAARARGGGAGRRVHDVLGAAADPAARRCGRG